MKQTLIALFALLVSFTGMAQDKIIKHNGEPVNCKVLRVNESSVYFKYEGEDAEQTIGKLAVKEIQYSSGRKEAVSEKIVVSGKEDWEQVQVVTDKALVFGLKKGEEIRGKTSGVMGFHTAGSADKKAMRKLMEAAAEAGMPFVLITTENDARSQSIGLGSAQGLKKGIMYNY
jgi:hypothetical protein